MKSGVCALEMHPEPPRRVDISSTAQHMTNPAFTYFTRCGDRVNKILNQHLAFKLYMRKRYNHI